MRARRSRSLAGRAAVVVGLLLASGCSVIFGFNEEYDGDLPQNALDPAPDSVAEVQDGLWDLVFPISVAVGVLVMGLIAFAMFRYRARPGDDELPKQIAGNTRLEIGWTLIPAAILALVAIPTVQTIFELATVDEGALNVRVVAKQYWWEFEYADPEYEGLVTATNLVIPTGREVQLDMQSVSATQPYNPPAQSAEADAAGFGLPEGAVNNGVIHSFWVPELAGKVDVVPGHTREMRIETSEEALYLAQCAEFCGLSHANMRFSVESMSPEDFEAWTAEQLEPAEVAQDGPAAEGQELFTSRTCIGCHAIEGYLATPDSDEEPQEPLLGARQGPNLTHFNSRDSFAGGILDVQSDDDLRAWLANPQAEKPGAQMPNLNLSEQDIDALVAYLRTLD